jgi:hypothetical protein
MHEQEPLKIFEKRPEAPEIPTYEFSIQEETRASVYQEQILPGLNDKALEKTREEMQQQYYTLMRYLSWLGSIKPTESTELENKIIESAKNFADCIAKFNAQEISNEKTADWIKEEQYWHKKFEMTIKSLREISKNTTEPTEENNLEVKDKIMALYEKDHKFFNEFALFVACQQELGYWDGREKVPVEK